MPLTDIQIKRAKPREKPFHLTDGKGMYLLVQPNGTKLWRYRYRLGGKQKQYAIGVYDDVSLADARDELKKARKLVKEGIDPVQHRKSEKLRIQYEQDNTFRALAEIWIEKKRQVCSANYIKQIEDTFENHVYPYIGDNAIGSLNAVDVLSVLERFQMDAPTLTHMTRQWMSNVFELAIVRRLIEFDPARMVRNEFQRPPSKKKQPLSEDELQRFLSKLSDYQKSPQVKQPTVIAIQLLLLTFVRTGELRNALWTEIDWEKKIWRIPAERMKMRREHLVPLSYQAIELLKELHDLTNHSVYLFPNIRTPKEPMNKGTVNAALRFMGYSGKLSAHAFRNTASTHLHEMEKDTDHIEMQLAHYDRSVRGRYNAALYLDSRRKLMQDWADFIDSKRTNAESPAS